MPILDIESSYNPYQIDLPAFVSAMERGAKGFGIESFLRYVDALGISPAQALQTEAEAAGGVLVSEEERRFIEQWRQPIQSLRGDGVSFRFAGKST